MLKRFVAPKRTAMFSRWARASRKMRLRAVPEGINPPLGPSGQELLGVFHDGNKARAVEPLMGALIRMEEEIEKTAVERPDGPMDQLGNEKGFCSPLCFSLSRRTFPAWMTFSGMQDNPPSQRRRLVLTMLKVTRLATRSRSWTLRTVLGSWHPPFS